MEKFDILLIDDDPNYCQNFGIFTEQFFNVRCAVDGKTALEVLKASSPDIVFLDYWLSKRETGLDVLKKIRSRDAKIPVIMISERTSIEVAVESMKLGAFHYTSKFGSVKELLLVVRQELDRLREKILWEKSLDEKYDPLLGDSPAMSDMQKKIKQYAAVDSTVLITGESGVGKELAAWEIHKLSARCTRPFIAVNCSAVPETLFESEFFGHERGAFTGALQRHIGYFELASAGTLFLDEIGSLNTTLQAKLLRVLERSIIQRIGGEREIAVDVRIISATNQNLKEAVHKNTFRPDLYHRLNVLNLHIPPLLERTEDIAVLAEYFLRKYAQQVRRLSPKLSERDFELMEQYPWPGNVRELKNTIERFVVLGDSVKIADLLDPQPLPAQPLFSFDEQVLELPYQQAREKLFATFQQFYFTAIVRRFDGNITKAAEWMGVPRTTVYRGLRTDSEEGKKHS
ncbi:MAG: sigma-54-dependent transcriptional regulator [bacterium]